MSQCRGNNPTCVCASVRVWPVCAHDGCVLRLWTLLNKRIMWQKTPWIIRAYGIALIAIVVLIIVIKVANLVGTSKPPAHMMPSETPVEQSSQVPVREIYGRVDALIRQALECMRASVEAQEKGNALACQVFAMQAFAYLSAAHKIAPKRTQEVVPDVSQRIHELKTLCAQFNLPLAILE